MQVIEGSIRSKVWRKIEGMGYQRRREVRDVSQGQKEKTKILRYERACVTVKSCLLTLHFLLVDRSRGLLYRKVLELPCGECDRE